MIIGFATDNTHQGPGNVEAEDDELRGDEEPEKWNAVRAIVFIGKLHQRQQGIKWHQEQASEAPKEHKDGKHKQLHSSHGLGGDVVRVGQQAHQVQGIEQDIAGGVQIQQHHAQLVHSRDEQLESKLETIRFECLQTHLPKAVAEHEHKDDGQLSNVADDIARRRPHTKQVGVKKSLDIVASLGIEH